MAGADAAHRPRAGPGGRGATVYLGTFDEEATAALGFGSPLSLPYLLDLVVPALAQAADGDPATVVGQVA